MKPASRPPAPAVGQVWRLAHQLARRLTHADEARVEWVTQAAPGSTLDGAPGGTTRAMWSRWVRAAAPTLVPPDAPDAPGAQDAPQAAVSVPPATQAPMPSRPDTARLPARALAALRALVAHAGPDGRVGARCRAQLADESRLSLSALKRALADLQTAGVVVSRGGRLERLSLELDMPCALAHLTPEVSQAPGPLSQGVSQGVSQGEPPVQDSFLLPLMRKKEEEEGRKYAGSLAGSLSQGEPASEPGEVSQGEPGGYALVAVPAGLDAAALARVYRALADALDPRPAVAPASPAPAPFAVAPPTHARTPKAQRLDERDHRGWTGHDAAGPCLADPAHGTCVPRLTRAEPREWIAYCPTCDAVRDPAKLEAARVASMHPEGAPRARQPAPPPEPDVTDRWAEAAARSRAALGEAPTGAGAVARAMADADRDESMTLRERVAAARAASRPVIQQRRPDVRQLVGAG